MWHLPVSTLSFFNKPSSMEFLGFPGDTNYLVVPSVDGLALVYRDPLCNHPDPDVAKFAKSVEQALLVEQLGLQKNFIPAHEIKSIWKMHLPRINP